MSEDFEIITPKEVEDLKIETLLQLLAVFVQRFGGEVTITQREFDMMEGASIVACQVTPEHLRLRLDDEYADEDEGELG